MVTYTLNGGCHCGNITVEMELTRRPATYNPRACDCEFCRKHSASYVSDPNGSLRIHVNDEDNLSDYRQGSGIANCILCRNCGVLVGVAYPSDGKFYAAVNSKAIDSGEPFGNEKSVSPKTLSRDEKTERWKGLWFANVSIDISGA